MKAIIADKTGEGEKHRSTRFEGIVNPIYCKAGKYFVYEQAGKKSKGENNVFHIQWL